MAETSQTQPEKQTEQLEKEEQSKLEKTQRHQEQLPADMELDLPQRPRSLGSNTIQESADYVLQLLHAYAAAFGL
ncbi:hypothetical protein KR222_006694 [Zaprionus bogoriensis]|nr:hypothetical protein KR222_006694 [Zaprionus bogoriensis]